MIKELWRDIPGIPGYQASDQGRVKSLDRIVIRPSDGLVLNRKGKILKLQKGLRGKYLRVQLCKGGTIHSVHRLVALAWKDNPHSYPIVRHLDDNGLNNSATNLQWGTQAENILESKKGPNKKFCPVVRSIMIDAFKAGFSKLSIGNYFGVTDTSVRRVVQS